MPSGKTKCTGHDCEEDLVVARHQPLIVGSASFPASRRRGINIDRSGPAAASLRLSTRRTPQERGTGRTYVELGISLSTLLDGALVSLATSLRGSVLGARVHARSAQRASCAERGTANDGGHDMFVDWRVMLKSRGGYSLVVTAAGAGLAVLSYQSDSIYGIELRGSMSGDGPCGASRNLSFLFALFALFAFAFLPEYVSRQHLPLHLAPARYSPSTLSLGS